MYIHEGLYMYVKVKNGRILLITDLLMKSVRSMMYMYN